MSIYVTGDTHGKIDIGKLSDVNFPEKRNLTRDDYVIVAGDFGGVWYGDERDEVLDYYENEPYTLLFVDGNHENFHLLNSYPIEQWHGGSVHKIREHVIHLMRGQIFNIEGKNFFTFGGGISIDKIYRTPGISWWPEEWPSEEEKKTGIDNLLQQKQVDYIVTHACPHSVVTRELTKYQHLYGVMCETENYLDRLLNYPIEYGEWYFGHYHADVDLPEYHMHELYQRVVKLTTETNVKKKDGGDLS